VSVTLDLLAPGLVMHNASPVHFIAKDFTTAWLGLYAPTASTSLVS
jgi:hypothetical protein